MKSFKTNVKMPKFLERLLNLYSLSVVVFGIVVTVLVNGNSLPFLEKAEAYDPQNLTIEIFKYKFLINGREKIIFFNLFLIFFEKNE